MVGQRGNPDDVQTKPLAVDASQPRRLRPGDTVALISPASPFHRGKLSAEEVLRQTRQALHDLGLLTVVGKHTLGAHGYLAGSDRDRAEDVMDAFSNPNVRGIVCMGGGYGTPRLLDLLDYDVIAANPKVFVGYSDITALHTALRQRAGLVTFHGPMGFELARIRRTLGPLDRRDESADSSVASDGAPFDAERARAAFTWQWFARAFMQPAPLGELPARAPWQGNALQCVVPGTAQGPLVGGNLSLLADTLGTPYEIDTTDAVLLIEEVGEAPYRIDRMLTQLRLAGKFAQAAGIIVAEWTDCGPTDASRPSLTLDEVLADVVEPEGKPTVYGLPAGHGPGRLSLPLGVTVSIHSSHGTDAPGGSEQGVAHGPTGNRVVVEQSGVA